MFWTVGKVGFIMDVSKVENNDKNVIFVIWLEMLMASL